MARDEIGKKIMTRKLILVLSYNYCFYVRFGKKDLEIFKDIVLESFDFELWGDKEKLKNYLQELSKVFLEEVSDLEGISYFVENFFDIEDIDFEFLKKFVGKFDVYYEIVKNKVNDFAESFDFENMDVIDQAIFLLAYIEFQEVGTKKSTIISEMLEISKRYGDEGSGRLINGILDKIL